MLRCLIDWFASFFKTNLLLSLSLTPLFFFFFKSLEGVKLGAFSPMMKLVLDWMFKHSFSLSPILLFSFSQLTIFFFFFFFFFSFSFLSFLLFFFFSLFLFFKTRFRSGLWKGGIRWEVEERRIYKGRNFEKVQCY